MKQTHIKTRTFDPAVIYVHDSGVTACGAHVGTEATYYPNQWEAIGNAPKIVAEYEGEVMELTCERCDSDAAWKARKAVNS